MSTFESSPSYMAVVRHISDGLVTAGKMAPEDKFAPMMLACDVAAETILATYPREEWLPILDLFLKRLNNTMDRRWQAGLNG